MTEPEVAQVDDGYGLRNLARHLVEAERVEDLHRLLSCEQPAGWGRIGVVNVWFDAHVRLGWIESYLDGLRLARQLVEKATDAELSAGRPATSLGRELRYALMIGCADSAAHPIAGPLGPMLVEAGTWDVTRALANVRWQEARDRFVGLAGLLPVLPPEQRPTMLPEMVAAAAEALAGLVYCETRYPIEAALAELPDELLGDLLNAIAAAAGKAGPTDPDAEHSSAENGLALLFTNIVDRLPESLLERALAVATIFSPSGRRYRVLEALGPCLPADLLPQARIVAAEITDPGERGRTLAALADEEAEDEETDEDEEYDDDEDAVNDGYDEDAFAYLLANVDATNTFTSVIGDVAPDLTEAQLARVVVAVAEKSETGYLGRLLVAVAPHVTGKALTEAFSAARTLTRMDHRARALVALSERLPEPERPAVLAEALSAARAVKECKPRLSALLSVAPLLSADQRQTVLAEALVAAQQDLFDASPAAARAAVNPPHRFGHIDLPEPTKIMQSLQVMCDALVRAQSMWLTSDDRAEVIAVLRPVLAGFTRRWLDTTFGPAFGAAVRDLGGSAASAEFAAAIDDSYRWWP